MAGVMAAVRVTEEQVRQFLASLLGGDAISSSSSSNEPVANPEAAAEPAGSQAALALHPRVDAVHPLGTAHSAERLLDALRLYRQLVSGAQLELRECLVSGDKALVTGHQVVISHLATLLPAVLPHHAAPQQPGQPSAGAAPTHGSLVEAATAAEAAGAAGAGQRELHSQQHECEPGSLVHQLQHVPLLGQALQAAEALMPSVKTGRVPTTIQLRFGKNDAGDPVVTQMVLSFSLVASLLPHLALQPWQQQLLDQVQPQLLQAMMGAGSVASVAEDMGTSLAATWRATAAVLSATLGTVLGELKGRMQGIAAAGMHRMAAGGGLDSSQS